MYAAAFNVCKGPDWRRKLAAVHQLLHPFIDAIHALEADKALLSQVITYVVFHANYQKVNFKEWHAS